MARKQRRFSSLSKEDRAAAADAQVRQFEAELDNHDANADRLEALLEVAQAKVEDAGEDADALASATAEVAQIEAALAEADKAMDTIELAIEATQKRATRLRR